jgi:hypothetical protein
MVLLDLSAAFDTLDHRLLLRRLQQCGITGAALSWLESYLQGRKQFIRINDALSSSTDLSIGVPQGSVLGPLLFLCYVLPVGKLIDQSGIARHGFADDTQLYCPLSLNDLIAQQNQVSAMETCLRDLRSWMLANKLKLNDDKTEVLVVSRKCDASKVEGVRICIGEATITPKPVVKNLGAQFDQHLTMVPQVLDVKKRAYYHLRNIVHIRPYLSDMACARAIHATVTSRLDFNNALLLGVPKAHINQLQVLHNSAGRVLTKTPQRQHISPVHACPAALATARWTRASITRLSPWSMPLCTLLRRHPT